jgi:hypothetical protein
MYIVMAIIYPLSAQQEITRRGLLTGIPLWLAGGLGWGYIMKKAMKKRELKNK